jgi:membrane-associated phospholipid phosphatase
MTRRPLAAAVTLAYLALTLPLLWRGEWSAQRTTVALLHVAAAGLLAWSLRARSSVATPLPAARSPLPALLPLLLVPFLYAELPYLMGDAVVYRDPLVRTWESALFGGQPARTLAGAAPNVALSELVHLGYIFYYPIVYVPPLLLFLGRRREAFARTVLAVMLAYVLCFLVFVVFPVEGPRYAWGAPPGVPGGPVRSFALAVLEHGSSRGTAFPSSHAAVAVTQAILALRYQRPVGVVVSVTAMLLIIGAVYGGFHYAIDVLVGAGIGIGVGALAVAMRPAHG